MKEALLMRYCIVYAHLDLCAHATSFTAEAEANGRSQQKNIFSQLICVHFCPEDFCCRRCRLRAAIAHCR